METIPVVLAGATGRTGEAVGRAICEARDLRLVGAVSEHHRGEHLGARWNLPTIDVVLVSNLDELSAISDAVLVDFTEARSAFPRLKSAIRRGWDIVVGTTGFSAAEREELEALVKAAQVGAAVVANFSIGAYALERLALETSRWFEAAEILEGHHAAKRDKPSGTALRMADLLARALNKRPDDIPVHSIRLPGLVAHQAVVFGARGQVITVRHDVHDRSAYAEGVLAAIRKVRMVSGRIMSDLGEILESPPPS
jgi:4-hydroxy-tetrahydrodipicolinate reductase